MRIRVDGVELEFQPTVDGYRQEVVPLGSWRRALDGTLHARVSAIKRRWTLQGYLGGQQSIILGLPGRGAFGFRDTDGTEYQVMCTEAIPTDLLGGYSLVLEEV